MNPSIWAKAPDLKCTWIARVTINNLVLIFKRVTRAVLNYTRWGWVLQTPRKLMGILDSRYRSHIHMIYYDRGYSNPYIIWFYLGLFVGFNLTIFYLVGYIRFYLCLFVGFDLIIVEYFIYQTISLIFFFLL
jgi:hypothetical protein